MCIQNSRPHLSETMTNKVNPINNRNRNQGKNTNKCRDPSHLLHTRELLLLRKGKVQPTKQNQEGKQLVEVPEKSLSQFAFTTSIEYFYSLFDFSLVSAACLYIIISLDRKVKEKMQTLIKLTDIRAADLL